MPPKGGIRKRLFPQPDCETTASTMPSSSSSSSRRPSLRARVLEGQAAPPAPAPSDPLPLMSFLKTDWGKGKLTSPQVEAIVSGARAQGADGLPVLSSNKHPQNLQRSLLSAFGRPVGSPLFSWHRIPTTMGPQLHPFLLPHQFFSSLFSERNEKWNLRVRGPVGAAAAYWYRMRDSCFVLHHPHLDGVDKSRLIPLGLHGDAGAFSKQDGLYVFTWNSLLGAGTTRQTRYLMTVVKKSLVTAGIVAPPLPLVFTSIY